MGPHLGIDWPLLLENAMTLGVAFLLALPTGWDRERHERSAGLRTFPLVALASCAFVLMADDTMHDPNARARILQGVITGIGFIGGGAILKSGGTVRGTATAACIWSTGALGAAVAWGRFEVALLLALFNFATLRWMTPLKFRVDADRDRD